VYKGFAPNQQIRTFKEDAMRRIMIALAGLLCITGWTVAAQHEGHSGQPAAKTGTASAAAKIRDAMSAAPANIGKNATIMDFPETPGGQMTQLRAGTNGWTCMPTTGVGGGVGADPMCLDKAFMSWADAWMNKKDPQIGSVGTAYMLRGDKGASNTDPFATAATPDNQWVKSGPHIMVITPNPAELDSFPTDPNNGGPWVMWKGTKYAHLMVPAR
jgi:hypothetical protein